MEAIKREGFGPEAHALDDSDPNSQTRTVIWPSACQTSINGLPLEQAREGTA